MEENTKETISTIRGMDMVNFNGQVAKFTKVNGRMALNTVKGH